MQVMKDLPASPVRSAGGAQPLPVYEKLTALVSSNAVVVFTISGCCMCHVVKQLLFGLGVAPTIVELDRDSSGSDIHAILFHLSGAAGVQPQLVVPAVFVGGKFVGGIESVMACHINGTLVPLLRDAGALWL
ncbi:Glutaredoxin-C9 [Sesamum alatum]|uniref:Glutaredoxin-C9 n=1 Tax=Sesamum alatum TaxID=300844 RepID=A0AAE1Z132_9LAMI|nr:Glutaredoxin-C9 [Sesamum alatum]